MKLLCALLVATLALGGSAAAREAASRRQLSSSGHAVEAPGRLKGGKLGGRCGSSRVWGA